MYTGARGPALEPPQNTFKTLRGEFQYGMERSKHWVSRLEEPGALLHCQRTPINDYQTEHPTA